MAAVYSFTATQNAVTGLAYINFVDTSTDVISLTGRKIYLLQSNGQYLVPSGVTDDFITWSASDTSINVNVFTGSDMALLITVVWETGLASIESLQAFSGYADSYYYGLTMQQAVNNDLIETWRTTKDTLRTLLDMAQEAISVGQDIATAQNCLTSADYLVNPPVNQFLF